MPRPPHSLTAAASQNPLFLAGSFEGQTVPGRMSRRGAWWEGCSGQVHSVSKRAGVEEVVWLGSPKKVVWSVLGLWWAWWVGREGGGRVGRLAWQKVLQGDLKAWPALSRSGSPGYNASSLGEGCRLEGRLCVWVSLPRTSSLSVSTRDVGIPRTGPLSTTFRPPGDACLFHQ